MDRRDFLIGGAGALATGATGCAGLGELIAPRGSNIRPADMDHFLTRLDGAMNDIARVPASGDLLGELQRRHPNGKEERLFRQGMRSLLLVGNFGDLSVAGQTHPGVQQRLQYSAPEMDQAVGGLTDMMASLSPTARADIKSALRKDPGLADRALEAIDTQAALVGVPVRRRLQLRVMGKQTTRRLKQSSDMLIDEYVTKCRKVAAQSSSNADMQRHAEARMGQEAFRARVAKAEAAMRRWQAAGVEESPIGYERLLGEREGAAAPESPADIRRPQVRIKAPSVRGALVGTPWIAGTIVSWDTDSLELESRSDSTLAIPLTSVTRLEVQSTGHWQEVPLPLSPTMLAEFAPRRELAAREDKAEASDAWYRVGERLFGFGLVTTAVGWVLILLGDETSTDGITLPGVVLGVTIGPLSILAALIIVLLGAAIDVGDGPPASPEEQ